MTTQTMFIPDAARLLGIPKQHIHGLIDTGEIRGVRDRWTTPRIPMQSVEDFIAKQGGWQAWGAALRSDRKEVIRETERLQKRTKAAALANAEASLPALIERARAIKVRNGRREVRRVLEQAKAAGMPMSPEKAARIAARKPRMVSTEAVAERVRRERTGQKPVPMSLAELKRKSRRELDAARRAVGLPPKVASTGSSAPRRRSRAR